MKDPWFRCLVLVMIAAACAAPTAVTAPHPAPSALDRVVADVCNKQVVLLGEPAHHGSGTTTRAKVELIKRLTDKCEFSAVFFESGVYDFLDLAHSLAAGTATRAQLGDAIGGLWSTTQEAEPMVDDLLAKATARRVVLAGLDYQVSATAVYAQRDLPVQLAGYLDGDRRATCEAALQRHLQWQYDNHVRIAEVVPPLLACLTDIQAAIAARPASTTTQEAAFMASRLSRFVHDALSSPSHEARDREMYDALRWHTARLAPGAKIIVWCATVHAAKDLQGVEGFHAWTPLGAYVHRELGDRAAAIGFSGQAGSWARVRPPATPLVPAPPDSLEGRAFPPGSPEMRYFDHRALAQLGPIAARALDATFARANWADHLDGLVVFHDDRPPTFVRGTQPQRAR